MTISVVLNMWKLFFAFGSLSFAPASWTESSAPTEEPKSIVQEKVALYVGTYSSGKGKGIHFCEMDPKTGELSQPKLAAEIDNASFLALKGNKLFAVSEVGTFAGKPGGKAASFLRDDQVGQLKLLSEQSTVGAGPCHLAIDNDGRNALIANYSGGNATVLPIDGDGKLASPSCVMPFAVPAGVDRGRQEKSHPHCAMFSPDGKFAFVNDLGSDRVNIFRFDSIAGKLQSADPPFASTPPGSGSRHFDFHPNGKFGYSVNELDSTVTVFAYAAETGKLTSLQTISTLPTGFKGKNWPAEVAVHGSGKLLFASNRGHDSIAVFTIEQTGKLALAGHQGQSIKNPRHFACDPTGSCLLVGNQDADSVSVFQVDLEHGRLEPTGHQISIPKPVCIVFVTGTK